MKLRSIIAGALALVLSASFVLAQDSQGTSPLTITKGGTGSPNAAGAMTNFGAPSIPILHPSSSNLVGAGCSAAHQIWWVDQNLCSVADTWVLNSSDPSALLNLVIGGPDPTTGTGTITLTFDFAGTCSGGPVACQVVIAVSAATPLANVLANLKTVIQANANLYNNVAGAQKQILNVAITSTTLAIDFDSRVAMKVTRTIGGTTSATVTVPASCATACANGWDINPTLQMGRLVSGLAPPSGSQMFGLIVQGGNSASPSAFATQYGVFANTALNSTAGALASRWTILTPDVNGNINQGLNVGAGIYSPARTDQGNNTANFSGLWTADVNSITRSGTTWLFNATTNDKIQLLSSTFSAAVNNGGFTFDIQNSASPTIARIGLPGISLGQLTLCGNTSGCGTITPQAAAGSSPTWTLPNVSGTFAVSATAPLSLNATTGALSITGAALTKTDDTNVTLTLGGTPATALLQATSLTLGWTGTLGVSRGGTGAGTFTSNAILTGNGTGALQSSGCTLAATTSNLTCGSASASSPQFLMTNSTNDNGGHFYIARKDRAGAAVQSGDAGFSFIGQMFANAAYQNSMQMLFQIDGAPSGNNVPSNIQLVTSNSAGSLNQTFKFNSAAHISVAQATAPTAGACGTSPAIVAGSTDNAGSITVGTAAPTSCTINFGTAWSAAPKCLVGSNPQVAAFSWVTGTGTIVVTQTATSSNVITWHCGGGNAFLMQRDLDPASNDNSPTFLEKAA